MGSRSVIAIIKGGLGNQLFTYASARSFALREGRELLLDPVSGFARDDYGRSFRLDRFHIEAGLCPGLLRLGSSKRLRHRWLRTLNKALPDHRRTYFRERPGDPPSRLLEFHSKAERVYLDGYWQSEECFTDQSTTIRRELTPPPTPDARLEEELAGSPSIFLHVRRNRYWPRLDADYYNSGITLARAAIPGCCFEVFGDDPDWARTNLKFENSPVRFHSASRDELVDLRLMTRCQNAIVANSSFSWWGAWLSPHPGQKVWTPATPGWPLRPAAGWIKIANRLEGA